MSRKVIEALQRLAAVGTLAVVGLKLYNLVIASKGLVRETGDMAKGLS
jgi:hypothetical protein